MAAAHSGEFKAFSITRVDEEILAVKARGHEDAFGWHPANSEDRQTIAKLTRRKKELRKKLSNEAPDQKADSANAGGNG